MLVLSVTVDKADLWAAETLVRMTQGWDNHSTSTDLRPEAAEGIHLCERSWSSDETDFIDLAYKKSKGKSILLTWGGRLSCYNSESNNSLEIKAT